MPAVMPNNLPALPPPATASGAATPAIGSTPGIAGAGSEATATPGVTPSGGAGGRSILSALLGLDASHNAGVAQNQANTAQAEASGYRQQAAPMFGQVGTEGQGLYNQGTNQYNQYNGLLTGLLPEYDNAANLPGANGNAVSPYTLNADQQQELQGQLGQINQAHQTAQQQLQQHAAEQGFTDPSHVQAGLQNLQEQFGQMANDHSAAFTENARQQSLAAIQQLMGFGAGQEAAGAGQQEAGIGEQGAAAGGIAALGSEAATNAAQQNQNAVQQQQLSNAQLGGILNLAGYAAGGGFNGVGGATSTPPIAPTTTSPITVDPSTYTNPANLWTGQDPAGYFPDPLTGLYPGQSAVA